MAGVPDIKGNHELQVETNVVSTAPFAETRRALTT